MHFTGPVFRPPVEAMLGTKLLQVTVGCAHNKCRFCTMYRPVQFSVEPIEQVEEDIKELRQAYAHIERIFLVNGDAFVLPAKKLKAITDLIIQYIPEVQVISAYASMTNIKHKSDEDLKNIKEMRINDLWLGTESGNAQVLIDINKGNTLEDAYTQIGRLNTVGIRHNHGYMLGVAGHGKGIQNAIDTAEFINATNPSIIWFGTLGLFEGSEMNEDAKTGAFLPATELEILEEEIKVLELIELENVPFYGIHPTNTSSVHGTLPQDREHMIGEIKDFIEQADTDYLHSSMKRDCL